MLPIEAEWLAGRLAEIPQERLSPLLNLGSSSQRYRTAIQPHVDELIFRPLRERRIAVVHADLRAHEGVDLIGDLSDPEFEKTLVEKGFRCILCNNVLEHVGRRGEFARSLQRVLVDQGYLLVSVPRRYPYHKSPIDTLYRPDLQDLSELFRRLQLISGEVLWGPRYLSRVWSDLRRRDRKIRQLLRIPMRATWLLRRVAVTCAIFSKNSA